MEHTVRAAGGMDRVGRYWKTLHRENCITRALLWQFTCGLLAEIVAPYFFRPNTIKKQAHTFVFGANERDASIYMVS